MCRSAPNIDWLLVDMEHGNISDDTMHEIVTAAAACGVSPIVRVAEGRHWMIKRALDSGAHGILVPVIETVEDAKKVAQYSKFPPLGNRGSESLLAVEKFVE
jgi:4-hydroxy-2-oxoheptanedioate aldolase